MTKVSECLYTRLQIENMEEEEAVGLKASLGLIQGCTIIVGSIIGSGIFIAPGGVLKQTGSVNMSLTIWILSGKILEIGGRQNDNLLYQGCIL